MRRTSRSLLLAVLLCAALTSRTFAATYAERVHEQVLPNGLKMLLLEDHKAPVAVFQIWYRVGSRNETLGRTGLSHLLEHMMFKGTEKVAPEDYSKIIQRNGGNTNAFTTQDYTTYFATMASDRLGVVNELEADRLAHLKLAEEQFTPERQVVMEERRLRTEDNPTSALFESISAAAYTAHPYGWPVIGWMEDVRQLTLDDLTHYFHTYYVPNNALVVAVGDFDATQLAAQIATEFGPIAASAPPPPAVRAIEPAQQGERRVVLQREAQLPFVGVAYHVPNLHDGDAPAIEVLAGVLAGGKSSRLYHELVYRQRLAREVGGNADYVSVDPGVFMLYGQPLPGKKVGELEKALLAEVTKLQITPPSDREVEKAKNQIEASFIFGQDSDFYQGLVLGQYEIAGDWRLVDQYIPAMQAVTAADVQRVATKYLTAANRTVGVLDPLPPRPGKRLPPAAPPPGMVR
ncbi:MAG: insulinase family protein [Deltaproteobacteria bacterium]|nr:insulinase family protein [Deltaproteobacteria bacterium]MBI3387322.1 insulinase family protein [Deltaproteobacteria bacterium]